MIIGAGSHHHRLSICGKFVAFAQQKAALSFLMTELSVFFASYASSILRMHLEICLQRPQLIEMEPLNGYTPIHSACPGSNDHFWGHFRVWMHAQYAETEEFEWYESFR